MSKFPKEIDIVSIHAPVMDAKSTSGLVRSELSFNPRARDGRERLTSLVLISLARFNPRARDGRECWSRYQTPVIDGFNPRARDGREVRPY